MEITRRRIEYADDFEYDQFEHGARKAEGKGKRQLDDDLLHFVVLEEFSTEKEPAEAEKDELRYDDDQRVYS